MKSIVPIILIVLAAGFFFFWVKPLYSEVSQLRAASAEYDNALVLAKELETLRGDLARKLSSFPKSDLARLDHFLPRQLDTVRIILDVDSIGIRNGLKLENLKVLNDTPKATDPKNAKNGYETVDVGFGFTASYANGISFMKDLEKSLRLLDAGNVAIKASAKSSSLYDFTMVMHTYWLNR
jgi:Tfp pilus assembly protein PilO